MATDVLQPESIAGNTNWTGTVTDIDEGFPPAPDGNFIYTSTNGVQQFEIIFGTPAGDPDTEANAQAVAWAILKNDSGGSADAGGADPTWSLEVSTDDGTEWSTLINNQTATGAANSVSNFTYPVGTGDPTNGSQIRFRFTTEDNGGGPNKRWVALDALELRVEYTVAATPQSVAGSITPSGSLTAGLVHAQSVGGSITMSGSALGVLPGQVALTGTAVQGVNIARGGLQVSLDGTAPTDDIANVAYQVDLDGMILPVYTFNIQRTWDVESSVIQIPTAYEDIVRTANPGVLKVQMKAVVNNVPTVTDMFVGDVTATSTVLQIIQYVLQIRMEKTAVYGQNYIRVLENTRYIRSDSGGLGFRSKIDPSFIPGDEIVTQGWKHGVNKVVFYATQELQFMELIRG